MNKLTKYFSIPQFRDVYTAVQYDTSYIGLDDNGEIIRDWYKPLPTLRFTGSEKLHGTNGGVGYNIHGEFWALSRSRVLTPDNDNAGFAKWAYDNKDLLIGVLEDAHNHLSPDDVVDAIVYGEWCGANLQPQVALSRLPKQFIIFDILVRLKDKEVWLLPNEIIDVIDKRLKTVYDYSRYSITIDFNDPTEAVNKMVELTNEVEKKSPIGLAHGVEGIGEGIVWRNGKYIFKVKGKLHSASHTKELLPIDVEKHHTINECVDSIVSDNRLWQGIEYLREFNIPLDNKGIPVIIKWVKDDCFKEELDTITASGLVFEDVARVIALKTRDFYIEEVLKRGIK